MTQNNAFYELVRKISCLALYTFISWIAFVPTYAIELATPAIKAPQVDNPTRVLFVGNSYFYYGNSLHNHVQRMAKLNSVMNANSEFQYKSATIGGASLSHHPIEWLTEPGRIGIKAPFELVILADGSAQPLSESGRARSRETINQFAQTIRSRGGQVALYMTHVYVPPHKGASPVNILKTAKHYIDVGNEIGALVIPVGLAFQEAYRRRPDIALHTDFDGSHPDILGTYLAACVTFSSIYGKPCLGNTYDYFGRIGSEDVKFLQRVSDDTVERFFNR